MQITDLKNLIKTQEILSKPELARELNVFLQANKYYSGNIYSYPTSISVTTYKYLLDNHNLNARLFFNDVFESNSSEKRDQFLDLALYHVDFSSIYSLPSTMSIIDLEKCLNNGLSLNHAIKLVLSSYYSKDIKSINAQQELLKYLVEKGANFSEAYSIPTYLNIETYASMLKNGLNPSRIFDMAISLEPGEKRDQLFDLALANNIDFSDNNLYNLEKLSEQELEKCLQHGLKLETIAKNILNSFVTSYALDNVGQLSVKQIEILNKVDINEVFSEFLNSGSYRYAEDGTIIPYIIPERILEVLIKDCALDANIVLKYGIKNSVIDVAKLALAYNADINYQSTGDDFNLITYSLFAQNIEAVGLLIELGAKLEVEILYYALFIKTSNFDFATQILSKLPNLYTNQEIYESCRANGASEAETRNLLDLHDLLHEYNNAKSGKASSLNQFEIDILSGKVFLDSIIEHKNVSLTNKYGYGLLHLAILGNQYALATKLVKDGVDIHAKTHNNITALQLLSDSDSYKLKELAEAILDRTENIDINIGSGETLTDILISNPELGERVIELTKDSLFSLLKNNTDLFFLIEDSSKTNIAISHGDDFWSTGIWSTARIITKNYPNVKLYLVKDDMVKQGGEEFIKQFDAIINPGAGDTYPKLDEFTKADCPFDMNLEKHYQNMLELSEQNNIPYLGMCAGAQHFSMYHGGTLKPLKGYSHGQHEIKYIEGTYAHFMALTKAQQSDLLKTCNFPEVKFKGDTAHKYAAINEKLGENLELGAISEDNVAMSYAHNNGIRYATQFHPEHYYDNLNDANTINQKAWINNFVELAQMHHDFRVNGEEHPTKVLADIMVKLNQCLKEQVCIGEDSLTSYYNLYNLDNYSLPIY
jgi:anthranilate/para-aminobenzoate synthase component II